MTDAFSSGTLVGAGSFRCEGCGFALALRERDPLPECPECGGASFRRALLFEPDEHHADHHQVTGAPGWLSSARDGIEEAGDYLAFAGEDEAEVVGWSRAGRASAAACRPTCASTTRRSRAATRSCIASPTAAPGSWTTAA